MSDPLHNLLRDADRDAPVAPCRSGRLVAGVRARHRRRRTRRVFAGTAVVTLCAVVAVFVSMKPHAPDRGPMAQAPQQPTDRPVALTATAPDAAIHVRTAELLSSRERQREALDRVARSRSQEDVLAVVGAHRDRAAQTLLAHADRLEATPADAVGAYQKTIDLFPETPAAAVAARRLEQIRM